MFGALSKIAAIAVDTATLPVTAVADIVTLGGEMVDRDEPFTVSNVKNIEHNLEKLLMPDDM
ncbi:hypothetical protein [Brucella intermedia]|uniref:hypothetical protein n=1 Tax=Brucella intermedia TaxID=94625 RepID=UPI00159275B1|nr:hypothetical protein [Brucella intermedia]